MHVAFFGTYGLWSPHLGTELELAEGHIERGDRISWILCDGGFESCETNPEAEAVACRLCSWTAEMGMGLLSGPVEVTRIDDCLHGNDWAQLSQLPDQFRSQEELKAFRFDGYDAGWGALSSEVWMKRDAAADPTSERIGRLLRSGVKGYLAIQRFLAANPTVERVYIFNGRMSPVRGALRAVQNLKAAGRKIDCHVHERGQDLEHYAIFENAMPHDIQHALAKTEELWNTSPLTEEERRAIGIQWFEGRPKGKQGSWVSFVKDQRAGRLPEGWDPEAHNVVLFTSSEYEYAAVGKQYEGPHFKSPHEATMRIARGLSERGRTRLTIRLHPNPDGASSSSVQETLSLQLPGVSVIAPDSAVSSYDLMLAADVVITSGSTTGIEATFWQTPSILVNHTFYSGTGACHEASSIDGIFELAERADLGPADREAAIRIGFYLATRGTPFRFFRHEAVQHGTFKGRQLGPTNLQRRILRLRRTLAKRAAKACATPA